MHELPLIALELPVGCDLSSARRIFDEPAEVLRLWPGVEQVEADGGGFRLTQRLELPFWTVLRQEFVVRILDRPRDRRQRYTIWKTEGWLRCRVVLWKLSSTARRVALDFSSQHALSPAQLEYAVNVYRSRTIWPMRHNADAILERLVLSLSTTGSSNSIGPTWNASGRGSTRRQMPCTARRTCQNPSDGPDTPGIPGAARDSWSLDVALLSSSKSSGISTVSPAGRRYRHARATRLRPVPPRKSGPHLHSVYVRRPGASPDVMRRVIDGRSGAVALRAFVA